MNSSERARRRHRLKVRRRRLAVAVAIAATAGVVGHQTVTSSSASAPTVDKPVASAPTSDLQSSLTDQIVAPTVRGNRPGLSSIQSMGAPVLAPQSSVTEADGIVPSGVTIFDDGYAAVSKLRTNLLVALRDAAADAASDGVTFVVNSGWRSKTYQEQLLTEAIARYGSEREAARWVATPQTSPHVSGDAVDIGPNRAAAWLSSNGRRFDLCQIYRNETWHFELRPGAAEGGCPRMYADPTEDPRMQ